MGEHRYGDPRERAALALTPTQNTAHHPTHNLSPNSRADVAHSRLDHDLRQALALTAAWAYGAEQGFT